MLAVSVTAGSVTDAAGNLVVAASRTAATLTLSGGSTADGATVGLGAATYEVTAADSDGTIASLVVRLDGSPPTNVPSCSGTGTSTATCTYTSSLLEPGLGAHTFTFIATDDEGNVTTTTRAVTVSLV